MKIVEKYKDESEKSKTLVQSVNSALQHLTSVELHPALKTDSRRYLKDVYYSIDKIESFKQRCIDKEDVLHKKISDIANRLKDVKQSIKDAKNERQSRNRDIKDTINNVFNIKVNGIKSTSIDRLDSIHDGSRLSSSIRVVQTIDSRIWR